MHFLKQNENSVQSDPDSQCTTNHMELSLVPKQNKKKNQRYHHVTKNRYDILRMQSLIVNHSNLTQPDLTMEKSSRFLTVETHKLFTLLQSIVIQVSPHYFFTTLNKERNQPYLQLRGRLNGKMLALGFVYPKSASIVLLENEKKKKRQSIAFSAKYYPTQVP